MAKHAGKKITKSHTTAIDVAAPLIDFAKKEKTIHKISIGIIKTVSRPSPKRLKVVQEDACILLKVRGNKYIQEIRLYTQGPSVLEKLILDEAKKLGFLT